MRLFTLDPTQYLPYLHVSRYGTLKHKTLSNSLKRSSDVAIHVFTTEIVANVRWPTSKYWLKISYSILSRLPRYIPHLENDYL